MFTAAVMACMIGQPMTYLSCDIISNDVKYLTEERCWFEINRWVAANNAKLESLGYEFIKGDCQDWFAGLDPKEKV